MTYVLVAPLWQKWRESTALTQLKDNSASLEQDASSDSKKMGSDSGYALKTEMTGFAGVKECLQG